MTEKQLKDDLGLSEKKAKELIATRSKGLKLLLEKRNDLHKVRNQLQTEWLSAKPNTQKIASMRKKLEEGFEKLHELRRDLRTKVLAKLSPMQRRGFIGPR